MCLDKLVDAEVTETTGYKVFDLEDGILSTAIRAFVVEIGKEYEAHQETVWCYHPAYVYPSGFHILIKLEDEKNYMEDLIDNERCVIRKVSFRNILAIGPDDDKLCVVAQYMTVLDET